MNKLQNGNIKLAIQKDGRLTEETVRFLRSSGLEFESYKQRLFSICRNFPLEILYVRQSDIPDYIASGKVDLGIVGQNILYEQRPKIKKLLNLRYGFCRLVVACLKESSVTQISDLKDAIIATSYPNSTKRFFKEKNIPITIIKINGSVELTPTLGVADGIVDLVSTGSTLTLNDLRMFTTIYESEAVLITNRSVNTSESKKKRIFQLLTRFKGVLSAKNYKYIMMNAPTSILTKICSVIPGLQSPTIAPLAQKNWVSVQSAIKEDIFWETIERLQSIGARGIIVLPIEKIIE